MQSITVIIPFKNASHSIGQCIESICDSFKQTNIKWELLLINDHSDDDSVSLAKQLLSKTKVDWRILNSKKRGVSNARNLAIKTAKNDYIWFIDSDDFIPEQAASIIAQKIQSKSDIFTFSYNVKNSDQNSIFLDNVISQNGVYGSDSFEAFLKINHWEKPYVWNRIYNRLFLINNHIEFPQKIVLGEDAVFNFTAFSKAQSSEYSSEVIYQYNFNQKPMSDDELLEKHALMIGAILDNVDRSLIATHSELFNSYMDLLFIKKAMSDLTKKRCSAINKFAKGLYRNRYQYRYYESDEGSRIKQHILSKPFLIYIYYWKEHRRK